MLFKSVFRGQAVALSAPASPPGTAAAPPQPHHGATGWTEPETWSGWDYAGMLAGFLLILLVTLVNARGRIFWEDEMLGWMLLRDPSWHHMIRAWNLGADGGGFCFYVLGRAWFRVFGASVLSFRLFTSTCFGLAFATLWSTLRRFYPLWIVAFATLNTLFFSPPLTMHFIEGRFYGLLVLGTALALWLAVRLDRETGPAPARLYLCAFLIHALLTASHVLGIVYSFFLLAAVVILDRLRRRRRIGLYLAAAAAWLLLLPERRAIHAAGLVGKPHFWTRPPTFGQIIGGFSGFSPEILLVLTLLLLGATLSLPRSWPALKGQLAANLQARRALYVAAGCLLLVPAGFLLQGLVGTWLFADRYLQPVALGVACLTAELLLLTAIGLRLATLRRTWPRLSLLGFASAWAAFTLALVFWVFHHVAQYTPSAIDFTGPLTAHLAQASGHSGKLPVVVEDAFTFTGLMSTQASSGVRYTFLLDWPYALSPQAPWLEVTQFHLMENWKRAGYFQDHIDYLNPFLQHHSQFFVIHNSIVGDPGSRPEIGNPIAQRLGEVPGYEVRKVFTLDRLYKDNQRDTVYLVCRGSCKGVSAPQPVESCVLTGPDKAACCQGDHCTLPAAPRPPRFWQIHRWFE